MDTDPGSEVEGRVVKESEGEREGLVETLKVGDWDAPGVGVTVPFQGVPEMVCEFVALLHSEGEGERDWDAVVLLVPDTELHTTKGVVMGDCEAKEVAVPLMLADSEAKGLNEGVVEGEGVPLTVPHSDTVGVTLGQVLGDSDTETVPLPVKHRETVIDMLLLALTDPLPLRDRELLNVVL